MNAVDRVSLRFDPLDRETIEDPYTIYARLREAGPVCRGGPGQWVLTRYAEVAGLIRNPLLSSSFPPEFHEYSVGASPASTFRERIILTRDPPEHTILRRALGGAFSPATLRSLSEEVLTLVDELLEPALERGRFDAVSGLAFPLPVLVVCRLLGVPIADRDDVWPRAADLSKALGTLNPSEQELAEANAALLWLRDYIRSLLEERRTSPQADHLSRLLGLEDDDVPLSDDEIVDNAVFLFFAGFETTMGLISNGLAAMLENPSQLARLRQDPTLCPGAVEECLRYDPPIQWVARFLTGEVKVGEWKLRKGRVAILLLASANRDERQFSAPETFDVARHPNHHLAFGGGPHFCLGAALARLEAQLVFSRLLERCRTIELAGEPVRRRLLIRSYASLPLAVRPA